MLKTGREYTLGWLYVNTELHAPERIYTYLPDTLPVPRELDHQFILGSVMRENDVIYFYESADHQCDNLDNAIKHFLVDTPHEKEFYWSKMVLNIKINA